MPSRPPARPSPGQRLEQRLKQPSWCAPALCKLFVGLRIGLSWAQEPIAQLHLSEPSDLVGFS